MTVHYTTYTLEGALYHMLCWMFGRHTSDTDNEVRWDVEVNPDDVDGYTATIVLTMNKYGDDIQVKMMTNNEWLPKIWKMASAFNMWEDTVVQLVAIAATAAERGI